MTTLTQRDQPASNHARESRGIVVEVDRTRSVRRAKRHSALVRVSRYALPVGAIGILAYYGAAMLEVAGWGEVTKTLEIQKVLPEHLTMNNPRYRGFTKDGGAYDVEAKTAQQDLKLKGLIRLKSVTATLRNADKSVTKLESANALYFSNSDKLILQGNIRVSSTTGGWARLAMAEIDLKSGVTTSKQPVAVGNAAGTINAGTMTIRQKTKEITFAGNVKTKLTAATGDKPSNPTKAAEAAVAAAAPGDAIGRMFATGKGPIEVDAQRLDVDDVKRVAIYSGQVKVRRDGATLEAPELRIEYDGSPSGGLTGAAPSAPAQADTNARPAAPKTSIKSIVASGPVLITEGAETRVTAAGAAYDAASSLATLNGGVVIDRAPDTRITGGTAAFNSARDLASIDDKVVVAAGQDRRATGDHLEVDNAAKTALLTGAEVVVSQGQNVLRGRQLTMDQTSGRSVLTSPAADGRGPAGRISAKLVQQQAAQGKGKTKAKPEAAAAAEAPGGMTFSGFRSDPSQPVAIAADALELNEKDGKAVFRGDVVAEQGDVTIRATEFNAFYTGKAGLGAVVPPGGVKEPAAGKPAEPVKLSKIQARGKVIVNSKNGQKATGDWADLDTTANTVTLGGDVLLTQGRNVVRGSRLVVDLTTGEAVIKTDNSASPDNAPEQPGGGWKAVQKPSRPSAVFFPQEATQPAPRKQEAAPGWQSTTEGGTTRPE